MRCGCRSPTACSAARTASTRSRFFRIRRASFASLADACAGTRCSPASRSFVRRGAYIATSRAASSAQRRYGRFAERTSAGGWQTPGSTPTNFQRSGPLPVLRRAEVGLAPERFVTRGFEHPVARLGVEECRRVADVFSAPIGEDAESAPWIWAGQPRHDSQRPPFRREASTPPPTSRFILAGSVRGPGCAPSEGPRRLQLKVGISRRGASPRSHAR